MREGLALLSCGARGDGHSLLLLWEIPRRLVSAVDPWSHRGGEAHLGRCVLLAFSSRFFGDGYSRCSLSSKLEGQQHSRSRDDDKPSVGARCASLDGLRQWGSLLSGGELFV